MKYVLIVGATSSLAYSLAHHLALRGCNLTLVARDFEELTLLANDLTIRYKVKVTTLAYSTNIPIDPRIDTMFMMTGNMGENKIESIEEVTRINYIEPAQIIAKCAKVMLERSYGNIVVISSVAGDRGKKSNYIYGSAKAALTCFTSGLRNYCQQFGINILTVKPGFIDTPMTYGMNNPLIASRDKVAKTIIKAAINKKDILYVPFYWFYIMTIIKLIPEKIFKKLNL